MNFFAEFETYLREQDRAERTIRGYLADLPIFITWFEQSTGEIFSPNLVTPTDAREFRQYSLLQKKKAANTVNRHLAALTAYFSFLVKQGKVNQNPIGGIRKVDVPRSSPRWLDRKEQYRLSRIMEQDLQVGIARYPKRWANRQRDFSLVTLLKHTGLRVHEVTHLMLDDLVVSDRKGSLLVRDGKGSKQRTIPLNADARNALRAWLEIRPDLPENKFVFIALGNDARGPLSSRTVQRIVAHYGRKADLPDLTPHILRHTFAKNLVDSGVTLEKVAALLGHSSLDTTRIYIMPGIRDLEKAVAQVESG